MTGIVVMQQVSQTPSMLWLLSLPVAVAGFFLTKPIYRPFFTFIFGLNWVLVSVHLFAAPSLDVDYEGKHILLQGTVSSIPRQTSRATQFLFRAKLENRPYLIKLSWYEKPPYPLRAGDKWRLMVKLKRPHGSMNPGGFDYERSLFRQHISATGYVRRDDSNQLLMGDETASVLSDYMVKARQAVASALQRHLQDTSHAGIIEALSIGERSRITANEWEVLTRTGTTHLIAISGLHIGLIAGLVFLLTRFVVARLWFISQRTPVQILAALASIMAALAYAFLAGFTIPTQRALLMVCIVMLSIIQRRQVASSTVLSLSLLAVLLIDPLSVLDTGFWLSFFAVAIILFKVSGRIRPASVLSGMFTLQFVIAIGMLPLMLWFFQRLGIAAPLANVIAVPWMSFVVVPLTLLATSLIPLSPALADSMLQLTSQMLSGLWIILEWLSAQPWAIIDTAMPVGWTYIPFAIGVVYLLVPKGVPARWLAPLLFLPALMVKHPVPAPGVLRVVLLDVGQGLSVLLQTQNHSLLFDTGPRFTDSFNAGKHIILPFLKSQGILQLDRLVVSHGDNDHSGGAHAILSAVPVHRVVTGALASRWYDTRATFCHAGETWTWDGVEFAFLYPFAPPYQRDNNNSCVLQVRVGKYRVLLPADIERQAEQLLVKYYGSQLQSQLLIAPHHGSKTSSSAAFIDTVAPEWVLVANGYRNRYQFPHPVVTDRYATRSIPWLETQDSGAISLQISTGGMTPPQRWRDKLRRYWHHR